MMNSLYAILFFAFILAACIRKPIEEKEKTSRQWMNIPSPDTNRLVPNRAKEKENILIFSAPDQSGGSSAKIKDGASKDIEIKLIGFREDIAAYTAIIQFENKTVNTIMTTLNFYVYDSNAKLVRIDTDQNFMVRGTGMAIREFFLKKGIEVRWIIEITGKN